MNNFLSLNWLSAWVKLTVDQPELARRLSLSGAGVEHINVFGDEWEGILVGKIRALEKHPQADNLTVCKVQLGNEIKQIVCGGINLRPEMLVAVATPGARVRWHGAGDLVEIKEVELRGIKSFGMICAAAEIGLGDLFPAAEKEILDLDFVRAVRPGTPLVAALEMNDTVFDIEATSNRPDLMSVLGVAREALAVGAAVSKKSLTANLPRVSHKVPLKVLDKKLCPRYLAARVDGVVVGESPWWMKKRLWAAGARPINAIVDITNYVRLELGQPLHAFDTRQVRQGLVVRRAQVGEPFVALDDSEHKLTADNLVIADAERVLCVAGVMGGKDSGVYPGATSVIFEAANFDPVSVRKTARALNLYSDSQLLFEKGLSVVAPEYALARALELTREICGGEVTALTDARAGQYRAPTFAFDFTSVAPFLGQEIKLSVMKKILTSLGFVVQGERRAKITVPWWRDHDIEAPVDFVEEIARIHGYHNIPATLPSGAVPQRAPETLLEAEDELADLFVAQGYNELLTYSFTQEDLLKKCDYGEMPVIKLLNPLSSEQTVLRPSLLPNTLAVVAENETNFSRGQIFEISNVYHPREKDTPAEIPEIIAATWSPETDGESFYRLKGTLERLLAAWGIAAVWQEAANSWWHPGRSAVIKVNNTVLGEVGELHPRRAREFGFAGRVAVFMGPLAMWQAARQKTKTYVSAASFPPAKRDLALVVAQRVTYAAVANVLATAEPLLQQFVLFDVYRGKHVGENKKSLAFHLQYGAAERTLTSEEVAAAQARVTAAVVRELAAVVRD